MRAITAILILMCTSPIWAVESDVSWKGVVPPLPSVINSPQSFEVNNLEMIKQEPMLITTVLKESKDKKVMMISAKI